VKQPFTFTWKQIIYGLATIGILLLLAGGILFIIPKTSGSNVQWWTLILGMGFTSFAHGLYLGKGDYYGWRFIVTGVSIIFGGMLYFVQSLPRSENSTIQLHGDSLIEKNNTSTTSYKDSIIRADTQVRFIPANELQHILNNR
jgi:hypothetical protein